MNDGQDEIIYSENFLLYRGILNVLNFGGLNWHFIFNEDIRDGISISKQGIEVTIKIDRQSQVEGQWLVSENKRQLFVSGSNTYFLGIAGVRLNESVVNLFLTIYKRTT